jgi:hypothetical protein
MVTILGFSDTKYLYERCTTNNEDKTTKQLTRNVQSGEKN